MMGYIPVLYDIYGRKLYAVERSDGYIYTYCDTRKDAEDHCRNLMNKEETK